MTKQQRLDAIARDIQKCRICKKDSGGHAVPGEGNPDADLVFMGEAPGKTEAQTGRPFVGRSGQLLRKLIRETGLKEENVFITSPVKYLPDRGTPARSQIAHGQTHTAKQIEIINPKIIVLLGKTAYTAFFEKPVAILKEHGKISEDRGRKYMVTIHPAAVLRFPKYRKILLTDFRKLKNLLRK